MRRLPTPDWKPMGWHYKLIHRLGTPWHNAIWLRANGMENLLPSGGFVYASNHSSWWDAILLNCASPRPVYWMVKKEMGNNKFSKWFFLDRGGCIPIDRDRRNPEALARAVDALREGKIVGIFPESTRYVGKLGPAKTGAARLALEAGVPVVPVGVLSDRFWGPGKKLPDLREKIFMNVGKPIHLSGDAKNPDDARRCTDEVMAEIGRLLDEARVARETKARWPHPR